MTAIRPWRLAAAGIASLALAGGSALAASPKNITIWDISTGQQQQLIKQETARFNRNHPGIRATVDFFQNNPYKQKLSVAMGSQQPPDIFYGWGGGILHSYVNAHKVYDLTSALNADPAWKNRFLPSMWSAVTFNKQIYGIPNDFVQPELFNYNQVLFRRYHVAVPHTWAQLLHAITVFKSHHIIPISLAGKSEWPELIYEEYLVDRIGGPQAFNAVMAGKPNAWSNPAFIRANTMIQKLVKMGAFETGFSAVGYTAGESDALVYSNKAAMQLMGSWDYQNILSSDPSYIKHGDFGWFAFPTVPGGKGNPNDVAGNLSNYYSISAQSKNKAADLTYLKSVPLNGSEVKAYIKMGDVPPVKGIGKELARQPEDGPWLRYVYHMTAAAPHFQLSWDQALPPTEASAMLSNLSRVFLNQITPKQFSTTMDHYLTKP